MYNLENKMQVTVDNELSKDLPITTNIGKIDKDIEAIINEDYLGKCLKGGLCIKNKIIDRSFITIHNRRYHVTIRASHTLLQFPKGFIIPSKLEKIEMASVPKYTFVPFVPNEEEMLKVLELGKEDKEPILNSLKYIKNNVQIIIHQSMLTQVEQSLIKTLEINDVVNIKVFNSTYFASRNNILINATISGIIEPINFKLTGDTEISIPDMRVGKDMFAESKDKKTKKIKGPGSYTMYYDGFTPLQEEKDVIDFTTDGKTKEYLEEKIYNWLFIASVIPFINNTISYKNI